MLAGLVLYRTYLVPELCFYSNTSLKAEDNKIATLSAA